MSNIHFPNKCNESPFNLIVSQPLSGSMVTDEKSHLWNSVNYQTMPRWYTTIWRPQEGVAKSHETGIHKRERKRTRELFNYICIKAPNTDTLIPSNNRMQHAFSAHEKHPVDHPNAILLFSIEKSTERANKSFKSSFLPPKKKHPNCNTAEVGYKLKSELDLMTLSNSESVQKKLSLPSSTALSTLSLCELWVNFINLLRIYISVQCAPINMQNVKFWAEFQLLEENN